MSDANATCPWCKGGRFLDTGYKEIIQNGRRTLYPYTTPCYCEINKSIVKKLGLFAGTPDAHPSDSKKIRGFFEGKGNGVFFGREDLFLYIARCYMLKDFFCKDYMVHEGSRVVEIYQVPDKASKSWLTVSTLNQYDLLILLFTSSVRYENSMKPCIHEVVKNRARIGKPVWIYARNPEAFKNSHEYSSDLDPYLEDYKKYSLGSIKGLKGFDDSKSESAQAKNSQKINTDLGRL